MTVVDTGVLYAFFVADDPNHEAARALMDGSDATWIVSPYVVAELDYFVLKRFGPLGEQRVLSELVEGFYEHAQLGVADIAECRALLATRADQSIGVTDASLVVLADRYGTQRIATFDRRHFSVMRTLDGKPFTLLP